jgi:hypothetical protein
MLHSPVAHLTATPNLESLCVKADEQIDGRLPDLVVFLEKIADGEISWHSISAGATSAPILDQRRAFWPEQKVKSDRKWQIRPGSARIEIKSTR